MQLTISHYRFPTNIIGYIAIFCAIGFIIYLIANVALSFQDAEILSFLPNTLKHGTSFSKYDLLDAFNILGLDGDSRARILSYLTFIYIEKIRLLLWQFFPITPALSPLWLLTLILAPVLLFKTIKNFTNCKLAALMGTAVYLLSSGLLHNVTMLFHPAKSLVNVCMILVIYFISKNWHEKTKPNYINFRGNSKVALFVTLDFVAILLVLLIGLLCDETAVFLFLLVPMLRPDYFTLPTFKLDKNNLLKIGTLACYGLPILVFALLIWVIIPKITLHHFSTRFDFIDYLQRLIHLEKITLKHAIFTLSSLLEAMYLPWASTQKDIPLLRVPVSISWIDIAAIAIFVAVNCVSYFKMQNVALRKLLLRLNLALIVFIILQTTILAFHALTLIPSGFYYGAIFSVLFALLIGVMVAGVNHSNTYAYILLTVMSAYLFIMEGNNVLSLNAQYQDFNRIKILNFVKPLPGYGTLGNWDNIFKMEDTMQHDGMSKVLQKNTVRNNWSSLMDTWKKWHSNSLYWYEGEHINIDTVWYYSELLTLSMAAKSERGRV